MCQASVPNSGAASQWVELQDDVRSSCSIFQMRAARLPRWLCNHGPDIASVSSRIAPSCVEQWRSLQQSVTSQGPCLQHRAVPVQLRGLEVGRAAPETRASALMAQELRGLIVRATLSAILTSGRPDETLIMWISCAQLVHAPAGYGTSSR